jgi:hypothetical protein
MVAASIGHKSPADDHKAILQVIDRNDLSDYINAENMVPARLEFERKRKKYQHAHSDYITWSSVNNGQLFDIESVFGE